MGAETWLKLFFDSFGHNIAASLTQGDAFNLTFTICIKSKLSFHYLQIKDVPRLGVDRELCLSCSLRFQLIAVTGNGKDKARCKLISANIGFQCFAIQSDFLNKTRRINAQAFELVNRLLISWIECQGFFVILNPLFFIAVFDVSFTKRMDRLITGSVNC